MVMDLPVLTMGMWPSVMMMSVSWSLLARVGIGTGFSVRMRYAIMTVRVLCTLMSELMQMFIIRGFMKVLMFMRMRMNVYMYVTGIMNMAVGMKEIADDGPVFIVHLFDMQHVMQQFMRHQRER
jgi:hypothetical protein